MERFSANFVNMDCMDFMRTVSDDFYDLAIVDPPYGHGSGYIKSGNSRSKIAKSWCGDIYDNNRAPDKDYFKELKRISKNQIIWGANHFCNSFDSASSGWIVWDKQTGRNSYADCELAYSSFDRSCKQFTYMWSGMHQGGYGGDTKKNEIRIHPSQKPVKLYDWIYRNYTKEGQKVFDSHLGSGSSAIAAYHAGLVFTGCEIHKPFLDAAIERYQENIKQLSLL